MEGSEKEYDHKSMLAGIEHAEDQAEMQIETLKKIIEERDRTIHSLKYEKAALLLDLSERRRDRHRPTIMSLSLTIGVLGLSATVAFCMLGYQLTQQRRLLLLNDSLSKENTRLLSEKSPDLSKACAAWWVNAKDLTETRRRLCGR